MKFALRQYDEKECRLILREGEVQVRFGEIRDKEPRDWREVLSDSEIERANRISHPAARIGFISIRLALRRVLASCLDTRPELVSIVVGDKGKPAIGNRTDLHFNVSHTDKLFLIALARFPVGIDVERTDRFPENASELLERFFTKQESELYHALPTEIQRAGFVRLWTCKEAVLKGIGIGLAGLEDFVIDPDPRRSPQILGPAETAKTWGLTTFEPSPGYSAALAAACE